MEFRIADTFTGSLAKLTGDEQKAVKTTAFDLQMNPANPGLKFHKLDRARDKNFWSVRVSRDIRLIVHRSAASLLLCYVDHHDCLPDPLVRHPNVRRHGPVRPGLHGDDLQELADPPRLHPPPRLRNHRSARGPDRLFQYLRLRLRREGL